DNLRLRKKIERKPKGKEKKALKNELVEIADMVNQLKDGGNVERVKTWGNVRKRQMIKEMAEIRLQSNTDFEKLFSGVFSSKSQRRKMVAAVWTARKLADRYSKDPIVDGRQPIRSSPPVAVAPAARPTQNFVAAAPPSVVAGAVKASGRNQQLFAINHYQNYPKITPRYDRVPAMTPLSQYDRVEFPDGGGSDQGIPGYAAPNAVLVMDPVRDIGMRRELPEPLDLLMQRELPIPPDPNLLPPPPQN
ncbi:MAG: hypothetical protein AAF226_09420, partial [Verrucomicrobiota bacterium]